MEMTRLLEIMYLIIYLEMREMILLQVAKETIIYMGDLVSTSLLLIVEMALIEYLILILMRIPFFFTIQKEVI